jgi:hypothetical protein
VSEIRSIDLGDDLDLTGLYSSPTPKEIAAESERLALEGSSNSGRGRPKP